MIAELLLFLDYLQNFEKNTRSCGGKIFALFLLIRHGPHRKHKKIEKITYVAR
jgi:hypothetical protein